MPRRPLKYSGLLAMTDMSPRYYHIKRPTTSLRKKRLIKKVILALFLSLGALTGAVHFVFLSDFFTLRRVEVKNADHVEIDRIQAAANEYLENYLYWRFPQRNYFLASPQALTDLIAGQFPELSHVEVAKPLFPPRLRITIRERVLAGTWCGLAPPCYLIDTDGVLYGESAVASGTITMLLSDEKYASIGERVLDTSSVAVLARMKKEFQDQFGLAVQEFSLTDLPDITARLADGWTVRFNATQPLESTLDALRKTLENIDRTTRRIEYIDLRIEGRAYYKVVGVP